MWAMKDFGLSYTIWTRRLIASACTSVRGCLLVCRVPEQCFSRAGLIPKREEKICGPSSKPH